MIVDRRVLFPISAVGDQSQGAGVLLLLFPSILCLGPALALAFFRGGASPRYGPAVGFLVVVALAFAFFLPVLSAQFPLGPDEFGARIWFDGWR